MRREDFHESCGVIALYGAEGYDSAQIGYLGLHAMQHRGQDGAGLAVSDGRKLLYHKDVGLVSEVLTPAALQRLKGRKMMVGHVRYATTADAHSMLNTQPIVLHGGNGFMALAHNGHLVNGPALCRKLKNAGSLFQTEMDSEVLLHLIAREKGTLTECIQGMMRQVQGSYALVLMTPDGIVGIRDPWGIRPLALGRLGKGWMLASESCAFDAVGAVYEREVAPGEIIFIDEAGVRSCHMPVKDGGRLCVFEHVYFARPDSKIAGQGVYEARRRMGELLSRVQPVEADLVAGVPDSALPAAMGYAQASGIPYAQVMQKNPYSGRTFITAGQISRERSVRMKQSVLPGQVAGRRIVLVDDSIVRGTNSLQLVKMLKQAGALQVHMRIASPPVTHPCHFGINTPTTSRLIGAHNTVEQLRERIGADSLAYLDLASLYQAVDPQGVGLCMGCFNGEYPMKVPGRR